MFKNKTPDGKNNLSGKKIAQLRTAMPKKVSQRALADMLQLEGLDMNKNAVQQIESGERFVTDIELAVIARVLGVSTDELLK